MSENYATVVPGKYGPILANPKDQYVGQCLIHYGEFSDGEVDVMREFLKPGDCAMDIGANVGALTLPMAQLVGDRGIVIAVEPQRIIHQMLCATLALNGITNTRAVWCAVSDHMQSEIRVPRLDPLSPNNFGGLDISTDSPSGELVWCPTVHDLLLSLDIGQNPTFLKIDAESMEPRILRGAEPLLVNHRPVLYFECDRPKAFDPCKAILDQHNYTGWWHLPPLATKQNFKGNETNIFGESMIRSANILAVPAERGYEPPAAWDCQPITGPNPVTS